jgi:hypothetical protein
MNPLALAFGIFFGVSDMQTDLLINQMGDKSFQKRELASHQLREIGECIVPKLMDVRDRHKDPEVSHRIQMILNEHRSALCPSDEERMPWIECLPGKYPDRDQIIATAYRLWGEPVCNESGNEDSNEHLRNATEAFVYKMFDEGMQPRDIRKLLDRMVANEKKWLKDYWGRYGTIPDFDE